MAASVFFNGLCVFYGFVNLSGFVSCCVVFEYLQKSLVEDFESFDFEKILIKCSNFLYFEV